MTNQGVAGGFSWFLTGDISKAQPFNYSGSEHGERGLLYPDAASDRNDDDLTLRLDQRFDDSSSMTVDYMHYSNKFGYYDNSRVKQDRGSLRSRYYNLYNNFSLSYQFKEDSFTPGFLRYFNNYQTSEDYYGGDGNTREQGIDYQNGWDFGKHKLIAGVEWHRTNIKHSSWDFSNKNMTNTAYYLQDTIDIDDKWTLIPGLRLDHNDVFDNKWSPKVAVNYRADLDTKIYASWGRVYRAPNPIELYESDEGNPNLLAESGHVETIGIEHDFDDRTNLAVSLFNSDVKDYVTLDEFGDEDDPDIQYVNAETIKTRGVEVLFRKQSDDHWSYSAGYTFMHRDSMPLAQVGLIDYRLPKNSFRAGIHYRQGDWRANLLSSMGSGTDYDELNSKKYIFLDFNTSYDLSKWATVYLKFNNITNQDHRYMDHDYETGERYFHSPGRSFLAGAQFRF